MLRSRSFPFLFLSTSILCTCGLGAAQQPIPPARVDASVRHTSEEWQMVAPHLPDPRTASADRLEEAADVLRARRLPDDAIDFYGYALQHGGDVATLMNKMGVTELEAGRPELARPCFKRAVTLKRRYAVAWNNLGAVENVSGNMTDAIRDYRRAVKLNGKNAIFKANLGMAYFTVRDYEGGRTEIEQAISLDGDVFRHGGFGGSQISVLTANDRGRFAFEMARLAATHHEDESMLHWLTVACESGYDVRAGMRDEKEFAPYMKDVRIAVMLQNEKILRTKQVAASDPVPVLPASR
jgi:tetratricopeptide (TPR) repeat protein